MATTLELVLTTDQKGAVAETAIIHAATKLGIDVYKPLREGGRYDVIFDLAPGLVRVQCKWAPRHADVVVVRCYSSRRNRHGLLRRVYEEGEVDAFAAYCTDLDRCFFIPFDRFGRRSEISLRLGSARNNQKLGITGRMISISKLHFGDNLGP